MSSNEHQYQENCLLWAKFNPKQAALLSYVDEVPIPSPTDSLSQAKEWLQTLDLANVYVLIVYGIGRGSYYDAIKPWLQEDSARRLVMLEDNLGAIRYFLTTSKATEALQDPQVQLLYFRDLKDNEAVLEVLYWNFAMTRIQIAATLEYEKNKHEIYQDLRQKITYDFALKNALVEEYLKYGGAFFINFYQNMLELPGSYLGNKTFGSFYRVPAIICGAGPSLAKSLPLLSTLMDKALIFAGGSALNAFNAFGIQPHLGAGIDPNPAQLIRLKSNQAYEVPFYYRNRMHHEAFKHITGPRLYITGAGGYDVSDWYEEKLGIKTEFMDEGHNVVNFCLQIAAQLGCNPIIFAGLDLAFTDMKAYAPGVEDQIDFDPNKNLEEDDYDSKPIIRTDIYGKPVHTLWKWVAESEWISEFAKEHSEITILNCTEGGIGFPNVPNESLKEAAEQYLTRQYPIHDRLHGEIQNSTLPEATWPKMVQWTVELKDSLNKCVEYLTVLIDESRCIYDKIKKDHVIPKALQSGYAALCETELAEEPGYQFVLDIFNNVQSRILNRELYESKESPEIERTLKKLHLNIKRLSFLRDTAKFNVEAIQHALDRKTDLQIDTEPFDRIKVEEPDIPDFHPIMLPKKPEEGCFIDPDHLIAMLKQYGSPPLEARVEKEAIPDGQCLLYYPEGAIKAETFYKEGRLHGPAAYFSKEGKVLSKSYYVEGKQEGESYWYYPSGKLYAVRRFRGGVLHGLQHYFYPNGGLKTVISYNEGQLS